jgi:hypothetical protein
MRKERTAMRARKQVTRHSTEHPLPEAAVPIGTCPDDISGRLPNLINFVCFTARMQDLPDCGNIVPAQPSCDIIDSLLRFPSAANCIDDLDDIDFMCPVQQWECIHHRSSSLAGVLTMQQAHS